MRTAILISLLCLLGIFAHAQTVDSIKPSSTVFVEKVYLHLNRYAFVAGDDIWFSSYLVDTRNNKPTSHSANLYVELLSFDGTLVEREVIRLENGVGMGDIHLGDSIAGGNYRICAYTAYMLNFGNAFVFNKEICVISARQERDADSTKVSDKLPQILFFPEGGSLVEGVESTVAFKAELSSGQGCRAKGRILDEADHEICKFETSWLGMGQLTLTPQQGKTYFAEGMMAGKPFRSALPEALSLGYVLHAEYTDSVIHVTVKTNDATFNNSADDDLLLRTQSRRKIYNEHSFELRSKLTNFTLPVHYFPSGIFTLTLFDRQNRPQCERLAYVENSSPVQVSLQSVEFGDSLKVLIQTYDRMNKPVRANLSLVVNDTAFVKTSPTNIFSYLTLESELHGEIEYANSYFNVRDESRFAKRELLLLTQGWRDYVWKQIEDSVFKMKFNAETGLSIRGYVLHQMNEAPSAGNSITMYMPKAQKNKLQVAEVDEHGKFSFDGMEFYGWQKVILTSRDAKGKKSGRIIPDSAYLTSKQAPLQSLRMSSWNDTSAIFKSSDALLAKNKYRLTDTVLLRPVNVKSRLEYRDFYLSDVNGVSTMKFDITPADTQYYNIQSYLLNHHPKASIYCNSGLVFYGGVFHNGPNCPHYWVNGLKPDSVYNDKINPREIDMKSIEKLEVIHKAYLNKWKMDKYRDYFIVKIYPKPNANLSRPEFNTTTETMMGYYQARVFYKEIGKERAKYKDSDPSPTLFWSPIIQTNEKGKAEVCLKKPNSSSASRISVEGLSLSGVPLNFEMLYQIK